MKRHIRHILVCLFCLSPLFSFAQTLTQYEYWFDGKVNNKVTVSLGGSEQTLDLDIPTKDLDYGMHQLFFRARRSDGQYSSVSRSTFFKLQQGNYDRLEYWLDGDRTNIKKLVGTATADGIMMAGDFDLTGATEGVHRLYYRATNADGTIFSAISMKPVMVKSRYADNGTEGKVTKYSMWVDNDVHKMYDVLVPGNQVTLNNTVDLGHLAEGDHVLSLQFGNDTEQWSEVSQSKFTHKAAGVPTVTLKATAGNDGTVRITYNSVPNDLKSRVTRIDKNGSSTVIRNAQSGSYPHDTFFTDNPAAGTYTYQAAIIRELPNGETEVVKSNIVSVTVGQEAKNVQINSIVGLLFIGNKAANLVTGGQNLNVKFSDGKVVNTGAGCTARYQDVEIGKTYTVSVEDNPYFTFEPKTVTVKEGMNLVSLQGKQKVSEENTAVQNDYSVYDLIINSEIKQTNNFVTMTVKNPSYGKTWKGKASLYTYDYNPSSDANQNLAASGTINTMYLNYICSSAEFTLGPSESKQIAFDLNKIDAVNFIKAKYDQYLYFFSNESANPKNKLMGCNENFSVSNPLKEKLQYKGESKKFYEAEIVQVFRDYLKTLKKLKSFNSKLEYLDGMEEVLDNMVGYDPSAYQSKYRVVKTMFGNLYKDYEKAMKAIDDKTKWLVEFDKYLTKLEELDKAYDYANTPGTTLFKEYNAFANIMKKINSKNTAVDFLSKTTCNIYLQTMDKAVNAIEEYTNVYFDNYLTSYLNDGSLKYILFVYRPDYNFWDKIWHETKCMQFSEAELWMIKEARIVVKIKGQSGEHVSLLTPALYEKKNSMFSADEYGIEFTSRGFGSNPVDVGKQNIEYFNLEIKWHNDFVTTIPICDEYSVIDRASTRLNAYVYLRSAFYKDAYSTDLLPYGMEVLKVKDITK